MEGWNTLNRRRLLKIGAAVAAGGRIGAGMAIPDKLVVLTFDAAVKSHRTFVAPLLKELGFNATFFVSHRWMTEPSHFMSWAEIAEIHRMGFEIGNHSWTHADFSVPRNAARLEGELALVERELMAVNVPRPVSFAYSGNCFGPEAVTRLAACQYRFARRGMQPEVQYGKIEVGPAFNPSGHHPLLIPTTGDAYPDWTLEHFERVVSTARHGSIAVLQFHGVPDLQHPWAHTPPERFREYMTYLKRNRFRAIALRDLAGFVNQEKPPADPLLAARYPRPKGGRLLLPVEMEATRAHLRYWLENMIRYHRYTVAEAAAVTGLNQAEIESRIADWKLRRNTPGERIRILPYPGGRHPRIEFREGAINPQRGTKTSVFLPWDPADYVVIDVPEVLFVDKDRIFLAHTYIPTIWNAQNVVVENTDWQRGADRSVSSQWSLPNGIRFAAAVRLQQHEIHMELSLHNGTKATLKLLRGQVCVLLKGAPEFNGLKDDNKVLRKPVAAVRSAKGDRWILTAWENPWRVWSNPRVPCMHSDPLLPDCAPGETVRVRGRLWFYEGRDIETELARTDMGALNRNSWGVPDRRTF